MLIRSLSSHCTKLQPAMHHSWGVYREAQQLRGHRTSRPRVPPPHFPPLPFVRYVLFCLSVNRRQGITLWGRTVARVGEVLTDIRQEWSDSILRIVMSGSDSQLCIHLDAKHTLSPNSNASTAHSKKRWEKVYPCNLVAKTAWFLFRAKLWQLCHPQGDAVHFDVGVKQVQR